MCSLTQRLFDNFPTVRTVLAGVVGRYGNRYHSKYLAEILQPSSKLCPASIRNRLSQLSVSNQVSHLQVLVGNQVARLDYAPCQLHGKVFTLPTYLEVLSIQAISRFGSILRAFGSTRKPLTQAFKSFFGLSQMTGIQNPLPIRVGVEMSQSNIQPNGLSCWLSLHGPLNIYRKLNVIPIGTTNNLINAVCVLRRCRSCSSAASSLPQL